MESRHIRILVADDHTLLRNLIADFVSMEEDMEVVGRAADGLEALELAQSLRPDLILLDLYMPRMSGLECLTALRAAVPEATVVVLSHSAAAEDVIAVFHEGAQGYLLKTMEPDLLLQRIRDAARGDMPIAAEVARCILGRLEETLADEHRGSGVRRPADDGLTPRELEIVSLIAGGSTNREIGVALMLSPNTVKNHIKHILGKLELQNRTQIATWATRSGMTGELSRN